MAEALSMAVHKRGHGPDLVLFHGGMGYWKHWVRNVGPLSEHFTVHALDHFSYGDSPTIAKETTGPEYLELMHRTVSAMFPGDTPLKFAGFSFGGGVAAHLAARLGERVTHLCLVSPSGFPPRDFSGRPTRSYKEAGDDETLFREICRHNLLVNMLKYEKTVGEEAIDIQAFGVRNTRFDSRKVSMGGTLCDDLAAMSCRFRLLWGEYDDASFRPAERMIGQIREAVGDLDVHRIADAGHWSAYENANEVNRLMIEFFTRTPPAETR